MEELRTTTLGTSGDGALDHPLGGGGGGGEGVEGVEVERGEEDGDGDGVKGGGGGVERGEEGRGIAEEGNEDGEDEQTCDEAFAVEEPPAFAAADEPKLAVETHGEEMEDATHATIVPWRYMMRTAPRVHPAIQAQRIAELRACLKAENALGVDNLHAFDYGFPFFAETADQGGNNNNAMPRRSIGDDFVLHRFLRARQFDVANARTMYCEMMAWRAEFDVDGICDGIGESTDSSGGPPGDGRVFTEDELAQWNQVYRQGYHGFDKGGRPIYIERIGGISHTRIVSVTTPERLYKKTIRSYEYLWRSLIPHSSKMRNEALRVEREARREMKEEDENSERVSDAEDDDGQINTEDDPGDDGKGNVIVDQMTSILDIEGIRLIDFDSKLRKLMTSFFKMASSSYPESLFRMYIVNAPRIFSGIWSVVKMLLDPRTASKIEVLSTDATPARLLKDIDSDQLPAFLGGTADWE